MIKETDKIKEKMLKESESRINNFVEEIEEISLGKEFTIDNIELLMTKYNQDSKENLINSINELVSKFDETKIIEEKKE